MSSFAVASILGLYFTNVPTATPPRGANDIAKAAV